MFQQTASEVTTEFIVNESWQRNVRIDWNEGRFCSMILIGQFLQVCVVGKRNLRAILGVNLTEYVFPALQHLARLTKLWMYYGGQDCCGKWTICFVKYRPN